MPRTAVLNREQVQEAFRLRYLVSPPTPWLAIAVAIGAEGVGESTIREAVHRTYRVSGRDTSRSQAARTAAARRWGNPLPTVPVGASATSSAVHTSLRTFGVEIEFHTAIRSEVAAAVERVVGYHIHMTNYHGNSCVTCGGRVSGYTQWKLETDSSATSGMRNAGPYPSNQGGELVSPVLSGPDGLRELTQVLQALKSVGAKVDRRHGMHVHIGAADLTAFKRSALVKTWGLLEQSLFGLVARSRSGNTYCRPIASRADYYAGLVRRNSAAGTHTDALNLSKLHLIGTVEARIHQGTLSPKKATMWVKMLVALVDGILNDTVYYELTHITDSGRPAPHVEDLLVLTNSLTAEDAEWFRNRRRTLATN